MADQRVSRASIQRALQGYVRPSMFWGVTLAVSDLAQYAILVAGVLLLPDLWMKAICSLLAGVKIANLTTLGHDAAHESLTPSRAVNKFLGTIVFAPGLTNWALWVYEHHYRHHPFTNGKLKDTYTPLSKAEYDALPAWRQALKRFHRNPFGLGFAFYYITERWWYVKFFPRQDIPARQRESAWRHFAFLCAYLVAFFALLVAAPLYSDTTIFEALLLGFAVPFVIWMTLMGMTLYFQHTHINIPWFKGEIDRQALPPERLTLHLEYPPLVAKFMHHVYDHAVHHVQPAIPNYRLREAQAALNAMVPDQVVSEKFTLHLFLDTMRRCQLYDYENHRWLYFDGTPSGEPIEWRRSVQPEAVVPPVGYASAAE
jgi:omega-6 fatty acid desaturase (delta-12 desaturase)